MRKTLLLNEYYEFDGEKCTKLDKQINIGDIRTNKAWYNRSNTTFSKIAMKDYQESQFQILDYEIKVFRRVRKVQISHLQVLDIRTV